MKKIFLISACVLFNEAVAVILTVLAGILSLCADLIAQIPNII